MNDHFYLPFEKKRDFTYHSDFIKQLTEYEKYQLSFHPERPKYLDYLVLFNDLEECFTSNELGGLLIQSHRAIFPWEGKEYPVMLIGQQTGPSSDYRKLRGSLRDRENVRLWNHGMPTAASYERALKAIQAASQEQRLIVIFVDTPGADPTEESEARGIAWRIGATIQALAEATVPTLAIIMNRACSGGAIALTGCDVTLALEYSTYLVITPEACSSILFHTRQRANEAAEASQITSRHGLQHKIVDELIPEPKGPAHRYPQETIQAVKQALGKWIPHLAAIPNNELFPRRVERWRRVGQWDTISEEEVKATQRPVSRLPVPQNGYVKRHRGCEKNGRRFYDPVPYETLRKNQFVCPDCGRRIVRPSAWDYLDFILDPGSFKEHQETRHLADRDILRFPGYLQKLKETRERTGLITAMLTGGGTIQGHQVTICVTDFGFLGGSFCMTTGEKIWRAAETTINRGLPMIVQAAGGGARMHEGCSSMVSIPKAHIALTRVERAGLPVITLITDPTLGGVAIGIGSRGIRLFEETAGNIGFSGKRVIEQYTGKKTSPDFQTTAWLKKHGHVDHVVSLLNLQSEIARFIS